MKSNAPQAISAPGTQARIAGLLAAEGDTIRTVLDIPCGRGALVPYLLEMGLTVHGADVQDDLEAEGVVFTRADMDEPLPFGDGQFDAVVCGDGIEHIHRQRDFLRECRRICRPGGCLIVATPNISALRSRWRYLWTGFHNKGKTPLDETRPAPHHHVGLRTFHELRYLLHTAGFRISAVACNRIKPISWVYLPLLPGSWLLTSWAFHREETDPAQRARNREIRRALFTRAVLFGETIILKAYATP